MVNRTIYFFLKNKLATVLIAFICTIWGMIYAPLGWKIDFFSNPIPVDALPDISENQQIVFTSWEGRSPQDIEDQITFPLTTLLLGISGVESIRSTSMFGFSSIYILFSEDIDFYWARSRILEKLSSLPKNFLPSDIQPTLGPDATALGQVFWYTLEGRDKNNHPTGGWDLHEIRTIQDFYVKYNLNSVKGVSEVASIGGFVQEYQIDVNPDALRIYNIPLHKVIKAVKESNRDIGAKTIEINQVEYLVRGLGYIKSIEDIEETAVSVVNHTSVRIKDIGVVTLGPAIRRGILDKEGAEVVGGVVVTQYGANPLQVIQKIHQKIKEIEYGLPRKTLADGTETQLKIIPFYDRTQLIHETLGTLEIALSLEILITILVVIVMVLHLKVAILTAVLLPISVVIVFVFMHYGKVNANIISLSGIVIAIGTMIDLGIIFSENVLKHLEENNHSKLTDIIYTAAKEVSSPIVTAVSTTVVSFIPVFLLEGTEGKLFRPLAFTKTFALLSALLVTLCILPTLSYILFKIRIIDFRKKNILNTLLITGGVGIMIYSSPWGGITLISLGIARFISQLILNKYFIAQYIPLAVIFFSVLWLLTAHWMPLNIEKSFFYHFIFVALLLGTILGVFIFFQKKYSYLLSWCLVNKKKFLSFPIILFLFGTIVWFGFNSFFSPIAKILNSLGWSVQTTSSWIALSHIFPGIDKEFMPALDEGSFLLMPTSMPHGGIAQNKKTIQQIDMLLMNIPEIELAVGKMGRIESALDPAPISMYENIINYKPEYILAKNGKRQRFKVDRYDRFILSSGDTLTHLEALKKKISRDQLIPDKEGSFFRSWRNKIRTTDDIWNEITHLIHIPWLTSAPKLQPIETRLIMLQTGMRAPIGIKVFGSDLKQIELFSIQLENILREVPSIKKETVFSDRIIGKPYIHLHIKRAAISRYGLSIEYIQQVIETAMGGIPITTTVEKRKRFPVRIRYPRELRDNIEELKKIYVSSSEEIQIPLGELIDIEYVQGPQMIKSENTFLVGYILFDKKASYAEENVIQQAQNLIQKKIDKGELILPQGISFQFSGNYKNQLRAEKKLIFIIPLALIIIFLILYFQFYSVSISLMVFLNVAIALSGGFLMLWLYEKEWFLNFSLFETSMRDLFQIRTTNLSVAVWIGFITLFGIATDDGVLIATHLKQGVEKGTPKTVKHLHQIILKAGKRRIRPAVMTSVTTIIALIPVLTSTGKGSSVMIPMAIPVFGGMIVSTIVYFITPVLYAWKEERKISDDHNMDFYSIL